MTGRPPRRPAARQADKPTAQSAARPTARSVALSVLRRVDDDGAYANLLLRQTLDRSTLSDADRRFVTDLVNGTTRMRRACDALVDAFVLSPPTPDVRTVLRLGAYQLAFGGVPPHAAVGETVGLAPQRARGFVNAVLRKVAAAAPTFPWSSDAVRLSYPDWIADLLVAELGPDDAVAAMERMDAPPPVSVRADGYVQDLASQWVAAAVGAGPGERVLDVCAGPGGKATALASTGASVVGVDVHPSRAALVRDNALTLGLELPVVVADGTVPPFPPDSFDRVLLDAPCSGLGALRRRSDARWRIQARAVGELADLQRRLLAASAELVAPGGTLVYSVCTLTAAESVDHPVPDGFEVVTDAPGPLWRPFAGAGASGWRLLPQDADTDGMVLLRYRRPS